MNTFTVQDIMNKEPCPDYTEEVVTELWKDKKSLTFKEVCDLDISVEDRIWIAVRLASKATVVSWANYCANEAQKHAAAANAAPFAAHRTTLYAARAANAAYYAASYAANAANYADYAALYAAYAAYYAAPNRFKARNEELERLLTKLVEMNKS